MRQAKGPVKLGCPQPRPLMGLEWRALRVLHYKPIRNSVNKTPFGRANWFMGQIGLGDKLV